MFRKLLVSLATLPLVFGALTAANAATPLQITFESDDTSGYINIDFDDSGVGHQVSSVTSGVDGNSGHVLKVVRGLASWAGTTILKDQTKKLITSDAKYVTANIYAPVAGKKLLMKLENMNDNTQSVEAYATQDTVVGWHVYTFDFAVQRAGTEAFSTTKTYNMASVFFDYTLSGTSSTSGQTYYLDDVTFASATSGGGGNGGGGNGGGGNGGGSNTATVTSTLLSYEANDTVGLSGAAEANRAHPTGVFGGGTASIVTDTVGLGAPGNKVFQLTKSGQPWTGYNAIVETDGTKRLTSADFPNVTFKYYSPKANSPVAVQLFIGDTMDVQMIQNASLGSNRLTFDFSTAPNWSASKIYSKLVVFPDFQVPTSTPADVYYFDDIAVNGATTSALPSKPANSAVPTLTNKTFKVGTTLTSTKGVWVASGNVSYAYTWYRCASAAKAAKCTVIAGQKASKYKLTKSDKGKYIQLMVTATNPLGSATAVTKVTGKVS